MPFIYPKASELAGDPLVGKGECVDLIKQFVPGLIGVTTQAWREGANVMASPQLLRGTAIATFLTVNSHTMTRVNTPRFSLPIPALVFG